VGTLRPLQLNDRPLVKAHLQRYPPKVSEMTFTNLFVWRKSRPIAIGEVNGSLVFLAGVNEDSRNSRVVFGPPLGDTPELSAMNSLGIDLRGFIRIPEDTASLLENEGLRIVADKDSADYVYRVADLAKLEGRRFHKKRNLIKQCRNTHDCTYEEITPRLIPECVAMQDRWCEMRECGLNPGLCNEYAAIQEGFAHYESFNLLGGAIRADGVIQAYAIGEELSPGTAVCHFEKAMPGLQGLGQLINQWFALYSLRGFDFVNREQDLGIPGLRQAKQSYYPHHMVNKFSALIGSTELGIISPVDPHECARHTAKHNVEQ